MLLLLTLACSSAPDPAATDTSPPPPDLPTPVRDAQWATDGQRLVVPNHGGFELFARDGDAWALVGRWHESRLDHVALHDDLVVATDARAGIFVVGIDDPSAPVTLAEVSWPLQTPAEVWLDGDRAMLRSADGERFGLLDLTDPTAPTWVVDAGVRYELGGDLNETACFLDGHAYALTGDGPAVELFSVAPGATELLLGPLVAEHTGTVRGLACHEGRLLAMLRYVEGSHPNIQDRATLLLWLEPQPDGSAVEVDRVEVRDLSSWSDMHLLRAQGEWLVAEPGNWSDDEGIAVFDLDTLEWEGTVASDGVLLPDATRSPDAFWVEGDVMWFVGDDAVQRLGPDLTWLPPMPLPAPI